MTENGKKLGLLNHIGLGVGGAIGTGIFIMLGYGIAYTGRSITLVCLAGCFFMLLAFWNSAAFGTMFVLPGGDYGIRSMVFPPHSYRCFSMVPDCKCFRISRSLPCNHLICRNGMASDQRA